MGIESHLPDGFEDFAREDGIKLNVRKASGAVKVEYDDGEVEFYYRGRRIQVWADMERWTRYRLGRYGFATLKEAKEWIDRKDAGGCIAVK